MRSALRAISSTSPGWRRALPRVRVRLARSDACGTSREPSVAGAVAVDDGLRLVLSDRDEVTLTEFLTPERRDEFAAVLDRRSDSRAVDP
jgi:hypothetical protein